MLNKLANSVKVINAFNRFLRWTALSLIYIYNASFILDSTRLETRFGELYGCKSMVWSRSTKGGLKSRRHFFFLFFFFSVPTGRKRLEWLSPSLNGCWLHCWDVERVTIPVMIGRLDDAFSPPEIDLDSRKIETGFFSPTLEYYSRPLLSFVVCLSRTFLHERINKIGKNKRRRERERERIDWREPSILLTVTRALL